MTPDTVTIPRAEHQRLLALEARVQAVRVLVINLPNADGRSTEYQNGRADAICTFFDLLTEALEGTP